MVQQTQAQLFSQYRVIGTMLVTRKSDFKINYDDYEYEEIHSQQLFFVFFLSAKVSRLSTTYAKSDSILVFTLLKTQEYELRVTLQNLMNFQKHIHRIVSFESSPL